MRYPIMVALLYADKSKRHRRILPGRFNKVAGFTIVELLIVIVIIGILAALVVVAYNGIQARTKNTQRVTAASQAVKTLGIVLQDKGSASLISLIPATTGVCYGKNLQDVNSDGRGDCLYAGTSAWTSENTSVNALLDSYGTYKNMNYSPVVYSTDGGIMAAPIIAHYPATIDGRSVKLQLRYYLEGTQQDCQIKTLAAVGVNYTATNPNKYTASYTDPALTVCIVDLSYLESY